MRNEEQYEMSNAKLSGSGRAGQASGEAEDVVGASRRVRGLDEATNMLRNNYYNQTINYMNNIFGDTASEYFKSPTWKGPKSPSKIETSYDDN